MKTLAERLVWARTRKNLSQEALASRAGVAQSTIGNLEAGIRDSARKLPQIANVLEVDALWLAEGTGAATLAQVKKAPVEGAVDPSQLVELILLFTKCGETGRRMILDSARGAAEADPVSASTTNNQFELRR